MDKRTIELGNGQQVEAEIIGQLGLHDDSDNVAWVLVTHVQSGGLIAAYSDHEDARDFARRVAYLMDLDIYAAAIAKNGLRRAKYAFATQLYEVRTLRESYVTYIPETMNRRAMKLNEIKARVKT